MNDNKLLMQDLIAEAHEAQEQAREAERVRAMAVALDAVYDLFVDPDASPRVIARKLAKVRDE
jgi:hypothetical protein